MVKANSTASLRQAFVDLCAEREDGGAGLVLQDVCDRAEVSRATAYRGSPSFKSEFDQWIGAMRGEPSSAVAAPEKDSREAYRKLVAKLANQIQAVTLQLDAERRAKEPRADPAVSSVIPFPGMNRQA